ncbi:MAG: dienelactone hydrolase family protein [Planctomycetes bacterium]|nr:dienelactone hydrolase family protein [Planctomycetota bacterium]
MPTLRAPAIRALAAALLLPLAAGCASGGSPAGDAAADPAAAPPPATRLLEYRDGETLLEGFLALPPGLGAAAPRPVVLVVHEWWGRTAHADRSAERVAGMGFVALAVDMYGKGRVTEDREQAGKWAGEVRGDAALSRRRLEAALAALREVDGADLARVACIGFCFGGTVSLNAAWSGMDLRAAVSFHGSLTAPSAEQGPGVRASVLVLHGADDPAVPAESLAAYHAAVREHRLDAVFVGFAGAVHSFTNPAADGKRSASSKYHESAARRAWEMAEGFLRERLR